MKNATMKLALGAALAAAPISASADPRSFVWNYEYLTMNAGTAELEYYSTTEVADTDKPAVASWKQQLELEYGLTDHTDLALYQQFTQSNTATTKTFKYDGMKLRLRHRLKESGDLPLDTLLYAEYKRDTNLDTQGAMEAKVILAKNYSDLRLTYNQVAEFPLEKLSDAKHSFYAGASWAFNSVLRAGVEGKGVYASGEYYAGPTLALRDPSLKLWANIGYLAGLNGLSKDAQTRLLIGVPF